MSRPLSAKHGKLALCYEAGPCSYGLRRQITMLGHNPSPAIPAQSLRGERDNSSKIHWAQIDEPPAHHAVDRPERVFVDHLYERRPVRVFQFRRLARRILINEAAGAAGVELRHPIPHDLQRRPADLGRLGACRPCMWRD
jgi:hypothetical protein